MFIYVTAVWVIKIPQSALQTSVSTNMTWWSLLSGIPNLFKWGAFSQWQSKQTNLIKTEALLVIACNHRKQQSKQAFPFSTVFLANLVPGYTVVPYNCKTRPVPSQSLNLEPRTNSLTLAFIPFYTPCIHITMWCSDDVMLFLPGDPHVSLH